MSCLEEQYIKKALLENSYYILRLLFIELEFPLREVKIALDVYCNRNSIELTAEKYDCSVGTVNNTLKRFMTRVLNLYKVYRDIKLDESTLNILELCVFKYLL